jgi:hypothetical protein
LQGNDWCSLHVGVAPRDWISTSGLAESTETRNDCNTHLVTYLAYHVTYVRMVLVWPCLFRVAIVLISIRFPECTAAYDQP